MSNEDESKPTKLGLFDVINNINQKGGALTDDELQEAYTPYMVNRALSNTRDTVFFANEMNRWSNLTKRQQYDFYYYGLSRKKRYGKWNKTDQTDREDLDNIKEYYDYSEAKAIEVLGILREWGHLEKIRSSLVKGGRSKK